MSDGGKRILLVEDELLIALDTQDILAGAGYDVIGPATSLDQAMSMAAEPLNAALLDVNLAGTLVWPAAEALTARGVPVVLLTGFGNALEVPPALAGAPRLGKPIDSAKLLELLGKLLP